MKTQKALAGIAVVVCTAAMSCSHPGPEERNRAAIIKANEEIFAKGNVNFADEAFSADYSIAGMEQKGPQLIKGFVTNLKTAFPDLQYTIESTVAEGNLVAWSRSHTGTHSADFAGYEATNMPIKWKEFNLTRFTDDGKIAEEWGASDFDVAMQRAHGIEGNYEFVGRLKGQGSMHNGMFFLVNSVDDGKSPTTGQSGTYAVKDGIITYTYAFSSNPKDLGNTLNWKVKSWSGDTATYIILGKNGESVAEGHALRLSY